MSRNKNGLNSDFYIMRTKLFGQLDLSQSEFTFALQDKCFLHRENLTPGEAHDKWQIAAGSDHVVPFDASGGGRTRLTFLSFAFFANFCFKSFFVYLGRQGLSEPCFVAVPSALHCYLLFAICHALRMA